MSVMELFASQSPDIIKTLIPLLPCTTRRERKTADRLFRVYQINMEQSYILFLKLIQKAFQTSISKISYIGIFQKRHSNNFQKQINK